MYTFSEFSSISRQQYDLLFTYRRISTTVTVAGCLHDAGNYNFGSERLRGLQVAGLYRCVMGASRWYDIMIPNVHIQETTLLV